MIITFSGPCHSGKTTFIKSLTAKFGDFVVPHYELIRSKTTNIDEIRRRPIEYFNLQKEVVTEKIRHEQECINDDSKLIVFDRNLIDSLFYYAFFVDKSGFSDAIKTDYFVFLHSIIKEAEYSISNIYDHIVLCKQIEHCSDNDLLRPKSMFLIQPIESFFIGNLIRGIAKSKIIEFDVITNSINDLLMSIRPQIKYFNYKRYNDFVENKFFSVDNTIVNVYGALYSKLQQNVNLFSSLLYTTDESFTKHILQSIQKIVVRNDLMNSRSHPVGYADKNNIMIIGMNPGLNGRAIRNEWLKPSFVFTKTSYFLKLAIATCLHFAPYITNVCKYACDNNKPSLQDFDNCKQILLDEINFIKPPLIIALGNDVYDYLNTLCLHNTKIVKVAHPAFAMYKNMTQEQYVSIFKSGVEKHVDVK